MLEPPRIVQSREQLAAVIRLTIPRAEIQRVMGPAIHEVMAAVAAQGIGPVGPVFSHHFRLDPDTFDFEVGVPVRASVTPAGRVKPGTLPGGRVARTIYHGPYEGLGDAWAEFGRWLASEGLRPAPNFWECYVRGPESGPDPADWSTELNRPVVD